MLMVTSTDKDNQYRIYGTVDCQAGLVGLVVIWPLNMLSSSVWERLKRQQT
jgi:hypothetical protein